MKDSDLWMMHQETVQFRFSKNLQEKGLVGIISHVNELKEQIDWKLNITKTEHGSQAKWEI